MAKTKYTPRQQKVINSRDKDVLVSASAGSGKTTVLVERVLQLLRDNPDLNIDDFLLVTFTRDAAQHMRDKIRDQLQTSSEERLQLQADRVSLADISTIDAFCQQVIRRYYYVINLDPQYRLVNDDTETTLLQNQAWDDLSEDEYAQDAAQKDPAKRLFERLVINFAGDRNDDQLYEVVQSLDREANAKADPQQWLSSLVDNYQVPGQEFTASDFYQQQLRPFLQERLRDISHRYQVLLDQSADTWPAYHSLVTSDAAQVQALADQLDDASWDELKTAFDSLKWGRFTKKVKDDFGDDKALLKREQRARDQLKKSIKSLGNQYCLLDNQQLVHLSRIAVTLVKKLTEVTWEYRQRYQQIKEKRHLLDFGDLEHLTYQIMTTDSDAGNQAQDELHHRYRQIMVDEYQDTNQLQDMIIAGLKTAGYNHLFMVGDVKQSIYRFRQADPSLFLRRGQHYQQNPASGELLTLKENFRSMQNVTSLTNAIFEQLMDRRFGEMDYDDEAHLQFAASWYPENAAPTELMLYDANDNGDDQNTKADSQNDKDITDTDSASHLAEAAAPEADKMTGEVRMIGTRILQMVGHEKIYDTKIGAERPVGFGDIAILSRAKAINNEIVNQFSQLGIPVTVSDVRNYFQSNEVRLMLDLLRLIDNPYQDIPLAAVLRSPVVEMTEPEMAYVRISQRHVDYYTAIKNFAATDADNLVLLADKTGFDSQAKVVALQQKVQRFLTQLRQWRAVAQRRSIGELIWQIYKDTALLDYFGAMPGGEQRLANLHALYQRANQYEENGYQSLYQFIRLITQLQKRNEDIGQAVTKTAPNMVSVMTIHGSKGLEFPVVFLVDTNHGFRRNLSATKIDASAGIGIPVVDRLPGKNDQSEQGALQLSDPQVQYNLPQQELIGEEAQRRSREEDMRILYVALTRAEQRLIITGSVNEAQPKTIKKLWDHWTAAASENRRVLPASLRLQASSFMDWLGMCLARYQDFNPQDWDGALQDKEAASDLGLSPTHFTMVKLNQQQVNAQLAQLVQRQQDDVKKTPAEVDPKFQSQLQQILAFCNDPADQNANNYSHSIATVTNAYQSVSGIRQMVNIADSDTGEMADLHFQKQEALAADPEEDQKRDLATNFATPQFAKAATAAPSATLVGTATHLVFQKMPLTKGSVDRQLVRETINRLRAQQLIASDQIVSRINVDGVVGFYQTPVGQLVLQHAASVHREAPFSMLLNADQLFHGLSRDDGNVLIHGIIDGYLTTGTATYLFDYKTDRKHRGESDEEFQQRMLDAYGGQLRLYEEALRQIISDGQLGNDGSRPQPIRKFLYLVQTKQQVEIK